MLLTKSTKQHSNCLTNIKQVNDIYQIKPGPLLRGTCPWPGGLQVWSHQGRAWTTPRECCGPGSVKL